MRGGSIVMCMCVEKETTRDRQGWLDIYEKCVPKIG